MNKIKTIFDRDWHGNRGMIARKAVKEWLPKQNSIFGNNCKIEGIVWHGKNGEMVKVKLKDFK